VEPTSVTWVILGLLALGPYSGYEIKQAVDRSTRFFWAASYGQIYPELQRLERDGLVAGESAPTGARRRRVFTITQAGRDALRDWLHGESTTIEYRDESLLRLFFADVLPREEALGLLAARAAGHRAYAELLRQIDARPGRDPDFVDLVLRWGIEFNDWGAEWCERHLRRLRRAQAS
jgi:PadR family transcriptional regulator AphA